MKYRTLAFKFLRRDWRSGELRILIMAVIIAVTCISSVGFFIDRVTRAMQDQSGELLGGDMALSSPMPPQSQWATQARRLDLKLAKNIRFLSVLNVKDKFQIASIKAVSRNYPLRGEFVISRHLNTEGYETTRIPRSGNVWLQYRLMQLLKLKINDVIEIGRAKFKITHVLLQEPDRATNLFTLAPRVLINIADINKTAMIQPGSRVQYRWVFSGSKSKLNTYQQWLKRQIKPGQRVMSAWNARPSIKVTMMKARHYFNLAALLAVILAGVAIAISVHRYTLRHYKYVALMRCFGCKQKEILTIYLLNYLIIGFSASLIGCVLGWLSQNLLDYFFAGVFNHILPGVAIYPAFVAVSIGLIILLGFGLPSLIRLRDVPPHKVLREEPIDVPFHTLLLYLSVFIAAFGVVYWQTQDFTMTWLVAAATLICLFILLFVAYLMVSLVQFIRGHSGIAWRYGIANLARRWRSSIIQIIAFGLTIFVILLLSVVRNDLIGNWQNKLPKDAANYFVINIAKDQLSPLKLFLKKNHIKTNGLYPMVRGRLVAVNDIPIMEAIPNTAKDSNVLYRELSLTWMKQIPATNKLLNGQWWHQQTDQPLISVEAKLAEKLGLKLNDRLTFRIGAQLIKAKIANFRTVDWASFKPNFYVIFNPGVIEKYPANFITSFYIPEERKLILNDIIRQFPTVVTISVDAVMQQVRDILDTVSLAIQYILAFTLLSGLVVLYAAIQASLDERLYEAAIFRAIGAERRIIHRSLIAEFTTLGVLSGGLASLSANLIAFILSRYVFDIDYHFNYLLLPIGAGLGGIIIGFTGFMSTRKVANYSPLALLR